MSTGFAEMSVQECRDRIAGGGVGRIAMCAADGPQIFPVNFVLVDDAIVFRTAPYTRLATLVDGRSVVFEVDDLDTERRSGWSVEVRGTASVVQDGDEVMRLRRTGPEPWATGQRRMFVRVPLGTVTGRHVGV